MIGKKIKKQEQQKTRLDTNNEHINVDCHWNIDNDWNNDQFYRKKPTHPKTRKEKKERKEKQQQQQQQQINKQTTTTTKNEKLSRIGEYVSKLSLELLYLTIFVFSIVKIKWDFNYAISGEARRSTAGAELDI